MTTLSQLLFKTYPPLPTPTNTRKHLIDGKALQRGHIRDADPDSFPSRLTKLITGDKFWTTDEMVAALQTTKLNVHSAIRRSPRKADMETYTENVTRGKIKFYRLRPKCTT